MTYRDGFAEKARRCEALREGIGILERRVASTVVPLLDHPERDELAAARARTLFKARTVDDLAELEERLVAYETHLHVLAASYDTRHAARTEIASDVEQPAPEAHASLALGPLVAPLRSELRRALLGLDPDTSFLADDPIDPVLQASFRYGEAPFRITSVLRPRAALEEAESRHVLRTSAPASHPRFTLTPERAGDKLRKLLRLSDDRELADAAFDRTYLVASEEPYPPELVRDRIAAALPGIARRTLVAKVAVVERLLVEPGFAELTWRAQADPNDLRAFVLALEAIRAARVPLVSDLER